jgi:hypothetical protein
MRLNFREQHPFLWLNSRMQYPMVPVQLIGRRGRTAKTYALLDSGADMTLFHGNWARAIGLDLESGRPENIGGWAPGTDRYCYCHRISLTIGSITVRCEVAFCDDMSEEMNDQLIGREVVFDRMRFSIRQHVSALYIGNLP